MNERSELGALASNSSNEMLPCPFCGSPSDSFYQQPFPGDRSGENWVCRCGNPDCEAEVTAYTRSDALWRWNRRPSNETSEPHDSIPARPYPGDEEAVRQSGVVLPYCSCSRGSDDPHSEGCKFWLVILAARKLWMDRNVAAWSCAPEARGEKRCAEWCGQPQFCTATGTDRRSPGPEMGEQRCTCGEVKVWAYTHSIETRTGTHYPNRPRPCDVANALKASEQYPLSSSAATARTIDRYFDGKPGASESE